MLSGKRESKDLLRKTFKTPSFTAEPCKKPKTNTGYNNQQLLRNKSKLKYEVNLRFETRINVWVQTRKWNTQKWKAEPQIYFNRSNEICRYKRDGKFSLPIGVKETLLNLLGPMFTFFYAAILSSWAVVRLLWVGDTGKIWMLPVALWSCGVTSCNLQKPENSSFADPLKKKEWSHLHSQW